MDVYATLQAWANKYDCVDTPVGTSVYVSSMSRVRVAFSGSTKPKLLCLYLKKVLEHHILWVPLGHLCGDVSLSRYVMDLLMLS